MTFHENRLLADDSHKISYLIFFRKLRKTSQNLLSAAVVIGALTVKYALLLYTQIHWICRKPLLILSEHGIHKGI